MISSSPALTAGCCAGSLRNHLHHTTVQKIPKVPKIQKLVLHPSVVMSPIATGGASAPPRRVPMKMIPCARPISFAGNHWEKLLDVFGKAPASPAPKRNRNASSETKFQASPVAIVKADHHKTMRVRTLRGPIVSPSQPLGISKIA